MKLKKLNVRGFSHHFVMAFVIVGTAIGGVGYLVASHAQVPYQNSYSCPSQPQISTSTASASPTCTKYVQTVVGVTADGSFGPITKLAVQKFQFANHVANSSCGTTPTSCDGIVGSYTWAKLVALNAAKIAAAQTSPVKAPIAVAPKPELAAKTTACVKSFGTGYIYNVGIKRCVVAVRPTSCPAGTVLKSIEVATIKYYFCASAPTSTTPVAAVPVNTADCVKIYGAGFFYTNDKVCTTITKPTCPAGTVVTTIPTATPSTPVFYYCKGTPTPKPVTAVGTTPIPTTLAVATNTAECVKIYGAGFFYVSDDKRCTSLAKPTTCPTGTIVTPIPGNAVTFYYCAKTAPVAATASPLVSCTYYVGVNETKTTKSTSKTACDNIHKSQVSWKDCPVVANGKTTTAVHSVAYCATHKPEPVQPVTPPPAPKPATTKPTTEPAPKPTSKTTHTSPTTAPAKPVSYADASQCGKDRPQVKPGQSSYCVAKVQKVLGIGVDGVYTPGGRTEQTIRAKQKAANLKPSFIDGITGPCTWHAIKNETIPSSCKSPVTAAPTATLSKTNTISCSYYGETPRPLRTVTNSYHCVHDLGGTVGATVTQSNYTAPTSSSGYIDFVTSGKRSLNEVLSNDGVVCTTTTFKISGGASIISGLVPGGNKYNMSLQDYGLYGWKDVGLNKEFKADGISRHYCFRSGYNSPVRYRVTVHPRSSQMKGSYEVWGYQHS